MTSATGRGPRAEVAAGTGGGGQLGGARLGAGGGAGGRRCGRRFPGSALGGEPSRGRRMLQCWGGAAAGGYRRGSWGPVGPGGGVRAPRGRGLSGILGEGCTGKGARRGPRCRRAPVRRGPPGKRGRGRGGRGGRRRGPAGRSGAVTLPSAELGSARRSGQSRALPPTRPD